MRALIVLSVMSCAMMGCATSYQPSSGRGAIEYAVAGAGIATGCALGCSIPSGITGGYYDAPMGDSKHFVGFKGNGYTSFQRAFGFALKRAGEVCAQEGKEYRVVNFMDKGRVVDVNLFGPNPNYAYKPEVALVVECFERKSI